MSLLMSTVKPPPERPFEGMIVTTHSEMSPVASVDYETRSVGPAVCHRFASSLVNAYVMPTLVLSFDVLHHAIQSTVSPTRATCSTVPVSQTSSHSSTVANQTIEVIGDDVVVACTSPSLLEQRLSAGAMSIQREICVLHKVGGMLTTPDEMLNVPVGIAKELDQLVEARLREDWAERKVEVR